MIGIPGVGPVVECRLSFGDKTHWMDSDLTNVPDSGSRKHHRRISILRKGEYLQGTGRGAVEHAPPNLAREGRSENSIMKCTEDRAGIPSCQALRHGMIEGV